MSSNCFNTTKIEMSEKFENINDQARKKKKTDNDHCVLSLVAIQILITPLVSSNYSS
jgi:hypothetical protein